MFMQNERELTIWAHYKSFNEVYFTERYIDLDELALDDDAWLATTLRQLAVGSTTNRLQVNFIYCVTSAVEILKSTPQIWNLCQLKEENLTSQILRTVFRTLELKLIQADRSAESKRQISGKFRSAIFRTKFESAEHICVETVSYKTTLGSFAHTAQRILNMKEHLYSLGSETPLGAVPHRNYLDLIARSSNILQSDLNRIVNACIADLSISKKNREIIRNIDANHFNIDRLKKIGEIVYKATSTLTHTTTNTHSPEAVIAAYKMITKEGISRLGYNTSFNLHALEQILHDVGVDLPLGYSSRQSFFSPDRVTTVELQAVFILLLCRTGWNRDSLVKMGRDGIKSNEEGFAFVLQGFKDKSDDDTPIICIEKIETNVIEAIERLIWGYDQLRQLGLAEQSDNQLWYSWTCHESFSRASTIIQMKAYDFISRNQLFDFALKEIRSTVMTIDGYSSKSYEAARQRGGHSSLGTTGRYLDHIITRSIASSINLQFQTDLEHKVILNLESRTKKHNEKLVRIGDGSMCADAYSGLYSDNAADSICPAQHCHDNGGCPNRRILIDEESIADIVRSREYYFKNWQRLRNINQAKFNYQIAPKIAFNDALYKYVKESRFGHILDQIEKALAFREEASNGY